jgi:hypothetical protein
MKIAGHEINNWYLIGGGALVIGGFIYWKHEANSSAASAAATISSTDSGIDPVTGLPYSEDNTVDPLTGMTYLAEAQEYGSVSAAESSLASQAGTEGYGGYSGTSGYPTYGSGGGTTSTTGTAGVYTTNAQWASAVQAGLVGIGYTSQSIAQALGLFFAQSPMDSADAQIMQTALAEYGPPPTGTYSIIPQSTGPGGSIAWRTVTAPGNETLAQMQDKADPNVTWPQVLAQNPKLGAHEGSDVPKGTAVKIGYASTTS